MKTLMAFMVLTLVIGSAFSVVYAKHQSRKLFVEVQQIKKQIDVLNVEWGQLQLEQSAWSAHGRIERIARKRLAMTIPLADEVVYVRQ